LFGGLWLGKAVSGHELQINIYLRIKYVYKFTMILCYLWATKYTIIDRPKKSTKETSPKPNMSDSKSYSKETTSSMRSELSDPKTDPQPEKPWYTTEASANHPALGLKGGKKPVKPEPNAPKPEDDPNHPVHKVSAEEQEKMRKKGINPVLKAEMDEKVYNQGEGKGFWTKLGGTAMGGGWIR
jgi:hypothetical protein